MGKAEFGTTKHLSNQMKAKGLQRLRFWCEPCQRQTRDDNAFKQHCLSESHVRNMLLISEDPKKYIREYSTQFQRDFINLLKTGHRDKQVQINHFYQEYISNKTHVHMNSTQWSSLTEFAKHLGKEGICRVEENDKGIHIAWIDDSPEALKRQEALRRKEAQDRGDEEWEQRMLKEQIKRAQKDAAARAGEKEGDEADKDPEDTGLRRQDGEKISLSIGLKAAAKLTTKPETPPAAEPAVETASAETPAISDKQADVEVNASTTEAKPVAIKFGAKPAAKNVFAAAKKNAFSSGVKKAKIEQPKKMSEAERIMREEMERKRPREFSGAGSSNKRPRM